VPCLSLNTIFAAEFPIGRRSLIFKLRLQPTFARCSGECPYTSTTDTSPAPHGSM
jgi:hypothetical protein